MGLKVWLPLTKDLHNQGTSQVTVTNNGATYSASGGKLGGCYSFDGVDDKISISNAPNSTDVSVALWFKRGANTGNRQFLYTQWGGITLELGSGGHITCSVNTADGQVGYCNSTQAITTSSGWNHICYTFKKGIGTSLYLNGQLITETAVTKPIQWSTATGNIGYFSTYFNGSINDFRIYDHCLSPQEIAEIAKGLILHYPLERRGLGQENLLKAKPCASGRNWTALGNGVKIDWTSNYGDTYWYLNLADGVTLIQDNTYTLSFQCSGLGSNTVCFDWCNNHSYHCYLHNGYNTYTFQMPSTNITNPFFDDINYDTSLSDLRLWNFKLEVGDKATPYSPPSSDTLYSQIGLNSNIEYDGSGFQNNGTRTGTFTWSNNIPPGGLYPVSMVFNGSDNAIQTPNLTTMISDRFYTISCWVYKSVIGSKSYQTIYGGPGGFELEMRNASSTDPAFRLHNWGSGTTPYEFNKWYHFCFVHTDTNCKLYINGELKITGSSAAIPSGNYFVGAWNNSAGQNFDGLMSDFRIYATALSENDIKSLYQNEAYVDTNRTVYGAIR